MSTSRRRIPTLLGAAALAATFAIVVPTANSAAALRPKKVVVFGIDGLMFDKIAPVNAPTLDALIANGRSSKTTLYANPMAPTLSGPGWATIATGVWPDRHKVTSNNWGTSTNLAQYPDFLTRLESASSALSTYAIADWSPLTSDSVGKAIFSSAIDKRETVSDSPGYAAADATIATKAATHLKDTGPDASFVYFGEVDIAGHSCGATGSCYATAIEHTDKHMGTVINAIKARPTYADEDWTFIVSTDHGHTNAGGHGGSSVAERSSFIIQSGPGVPAGTFTVKPKNVDIAATVLGIHGVSAALDGQVLGTASTDPFEGVTLKPRVDETGIPSGVLGWTNSVPSGWGIDSTGMGTGGMTEWRGWSLTNDDFWTRTQADQQRESNVRARGVFAVADSDEWSDKATSGTFNSALVSAPYAVTAGRTATIGFGSHYLKEGSETTTVSVSFNGGAETQILKYTGNAVAKVERLTVTIPSGATSMVVRWRLANGANNWYWAVDNPSVSVS
ncbi:alkaline phosphatase family protein [Actinokineospora sp.]|uniref:alkaline phosphatase family protein n=1 Tax=Actinokineospora sp. TaxID=1872133 RepID=UPI003D6A5FC8